jgi:hypothetical protein
MVLDYGMRERTRDQYQGWLAGHYDVIPDSGPGEQNVSTSTSIRTHEKTIDKSNTGWALIESLWRAGKLTTHQKNFWRKQDLGGPFLNERQNYSQIVPFFSKKVRFGSPPNGLVYQNNQQVIGFPIGAITPTSTVWPQLSPDDEQELWGMGSTAIKLTAPALPREGVAVFLGELREGLPRLARNLGSLPEIANSSSSNYLGYQFGLRPLLSDIKSISSTIKNMDKELRRLEDQSADLIHRKYSFDDTRDETLIETSTVTAWPGAPSNVHPGTGSRKKFKIEHNKTWFAGAFSYYFPRAREGLSVLRTWLDELGAGVNVDTLYNLTPYTWLMDWFGNFGDVLFNLSYFTQNSQVLNYGYLMRTSEITHRYEFTPQSGGTSQQDFTVIRKLRIKASPFGFGLSEEDFTDFQKSILLALGISRAT